MRLDLLDPSVAARWTVPEVLSVRECADLTAQVERTGFKAAPTLTERGEELLPEFRDSDRVTLDDKPLAAELFGRLERALPRVVRGMKLARLHHHMVVYRYREGQRFAPHFDGSLLHGAEESQLTCLVYLNEDFSGGETYFFDGNEGIIPRTGLALLFQHEQLHEGRAVVSGVKYVLRADVMYRLPQTT